MLRPSLALAAPALGLALALVPAPARDIEGTATEMFLEALERAETSLERGDLDGARAQIDRALERDRRSLAAWDLYARWASASAARDEEVYARFRILEYARAQGRPKKELEAHEAALVTLDPQALDLLALPEQFVEELAELADEHVKDGRPHSAIAVHKRILSLASEREESVRAIEELAAAPDPSLAEDAKPKDLFEDVTEEWMAEHDADHRDWGDRAKLLRENYVTQTNAGYRVLVTAAEAMEQMNAFYRVFFGYGVGKSGGSVPRIDLLIFKNRDEYLEKGSGPPAEWSAGQFTGGSVETYIGSGGFEGMTGTLFHEAAHQFVSLATNAVGWLNEGLASFFEGCRILPNGTVLMNMPANHRLFPLAIRMENGWMEDEEDGIDQDNPANSNPTKAPTFRIVLENRYEWGPPWYAPTWGVVYFLYNFQDPLDGRFVYRAAFREFIDKSGGRVGEGAVENFEDVVLKNPSKPTPGLGKEASVTLPETVEDLDAVWKDYIVALRDEQSGVVAAKRPYLEWARHAITREEPDVASEHFEKGLVASPFDVDLLEEFAAYLADERDNPDRASKLQLRAVQLLERAGDTDPERLEQAEKRLAKYDPNRRTLEELETQMGAAVEALVRRYLADGLPSMAMWLSWRMGTELGSDALFELYAEGLASRGSGLSLWELAYDEVGLSNWNASDGETWLPTGERLQAKNGEFAEDVFDFRFLTLDRVTGGNFSFEADVMARTGRGSFAGLVFGQKNTITFHSLLLFPPRVNKSELATDTAFVDLTSFFSDSSNKVWRHLPVETVDERDTRSDRWYTLRIDVVGGTVDAWVDGEYVATQTFEDPGVLSGKLGLIVGPGEYSFRDVRFQVRDPKDAAAKLERDQRMAELAAEGEGLGGSFLGMVPPLPEVDRWLTEPLGDWAELGVVPKLFVMWSVDQNDAIPLHDWLDRLSERYADIGLEIVSVVSANDAERAEEYIEEKGFPGLCAIDRREDYGFGDTFERYSIPRFNLPRVILLDVNDEVVWEGDPGFSVGIPWRPGDGSFLDTPLEELIRARKLDRVVPWARRYEDAGRAALTAGDLSTALPHLIEALELEGARHPSLDEARGLLAGVEAAIAALETTAASLERSEAEPALDALLEIGASLGIEPDKRALRGVGALGKGAHAKAWKQCLEDVADWWKLVAKGRQAASVEELCASLRERPGLMPERLAARLAAAGEPSARWVQEARWVPLGWLVQEYFRIAP